MINEKVKVAYGTEHMEALIERAQKEANFLRPLLEEQEAIVRETYLEMADRNKITDLAVRAKLLEEDKFIICVAEANIEKITKRLEQLDGAINGLEASVENLRKMNTQEALRCAKKAASFFR